SKPVEGIGLPDASNALLARPVKVKVPRAFESVRTFNCMRRNETPAVRLCVPLTVEVFSLMLELWIRLRTGLASESAPKLVNERLGGPKLIGSVAVPRIPRSAATSVLKAKKGSVSLRFRLKLNDRTLMVFCARLRV